MMFVLLAVQDNGSSVVVCFVVCVALERGSFGFTHNDAQGW